MAGNNKYFMMGNAALARGAYEAGVVFAAAYPGTPSTQIFENAAKYPEIYSEWATNEAVAAELAIGAQMAGVRALCSMKHFGFNVAADPIFPCVYNGVLAGLVFVVADDPGQATSSTEPDARRWGPQMRIPILEPADSQECKDFTKAAYEISERFDTPILIRLTARISHGTGIVTFAERQAVPIKPYTRNLSKNVGMSSLGKFKHARLEARVKDLAQFSDETDLNRIEWGEREIGVISNGISYQYVKEIFGDGASYLKIGFSYPLPEKKIREFAAGVRKLYIVEELDPYMEEYVKQLGIPCVGKEIIPAVNELSIDVIKEAFGVTGEKRRRLDIKAPERTPNFCAGCTHRGVYTAMKKHLKKVIACGDIGCYNLAVLPPYSVHETMQDMGGSIPTAISFWKVFQLAGRPEKPFAFIGDSTFFHSGMTGLADAVYRKANIVVFILDNRSTAMTGHQDHPGSGRMMDKTPTEPIEIDDIARGMGIKEDQIRYVDPYDLADLDNAIQEGIAADKLYFIVARRPCPLLPETRKARAGISCVVSADKCTNCKACVRQTGCPALSIAEGKAVIEREDCNGCGICAQICRFQAIETVGGLR
ncbi:MAG: 4Fe-4S binding protein [Gracilibacteraceae bacterium]|jgi:indolepyruvate ferredoxin oxidoreductase alpha subunit|nr:4Fe-4S binding protein [Gracilibacteraceae bacterium]